MVVELNEFEQKALCQLLASYLEAHPHISEAEFEALPITQKFHAEKRIEMNGQTYTEADYVAEYRNMEKSRAMLVDLLAKIS